MVVALRTNIRRSQEIFKCRVSEAEEPGVVLLNPDTVGVVYGGRLLQPLRQALDTNVIVSGGPLNELRGLNCFTTMLAPCVKSMDLTCIPQMRLVGRGRSFRGTATASSVS